MSASENLSPQQFFHGSPYTMKPGDLLTPPGNNREPTHVPPDDHGQRDYVFATTKLSRAGLFSGGTGPGSGHVYHVEPTGDVEPDSYDNGHNRSVNSFKSRSPFRVVSEIPNELWDA